MTKIQNSKRRRNTTFSNIRDLDFGNCFGFRISDFGFTRAARAFTVLELLVVIAIIIVLAGLILATSGYVQKKGARSRAEAEIAAMSAALESYKADNGIYPSNSATNSLDPATVNPQSYVPACQGLYMQLSGDSDDNPTTSSANDTKAYMPFKPNMLSPNPPASNTYIRDPFGNAYGYSTMKASGGTGGFNPTFDLWSTAGGTGTADVPGWVKNW